MRVWVAMVLAAFLLASCSGNEAPTNEETRFVTQIVTAAAPAPSEATNAPEESNASQHESPEDVLALQYEYARARG